MFDDLDPCYSVNVNLQTDEQFYFILVCGQTSWYSKGKGQFYCPSSQRELGHISTKNMLVLMMM